eukprot:944810_1
MEAGAATTLPESCISATDEAASCSPGEAGEPNEGSICLMEMDVQSESTSQTALNQSTIEIQSDPPPDRIVPPVDVQSSTMVVDSMPTEDCVNKPELSLKCDDHSDQSVNCGSIQHSGQENTNASATPPAPVSAKTLTMCPESEPVPVISPESASQSPPVVSRDCSIRRIKSPENVSCTIASPGTSEGDKMLSEVAPPQIVQDAYPRSEIKSSESTSEPMSVELPKCVSVAPEEKSSECTNLDSPRSVSKPTSECTQIDFPNSAKVMPKPTSECIQLDSPKSAKVMPQPTSSECNQIESPKLVNVVSVPVPSKNSQVESSKSADALSEPGSVVIIQVKSPEISNVALPEPECSESVQMECSKSGKALSEPTSPENNPVATPPGVTISSQPISSETIQVESQVLNKVVLSDSTLSESTKITSPPSTKVVSEAPTIECAQA